MDRVGRRPFRTYVGERGGGEGTRGEGEVCKRCWGGRCLGGGKMFEGGKRKKVRGGRRLWGRAGEKVELYRGEGAGI